MPPVKVAYLLAPFILAVLFAALVVVLVWMADEEVVVATPREVYEAHIDALADGDWALSDSYVKPGCSVGDQGFLDEVLESGLDFHEEFAIDELWILEDGTEVVIFLDSEYEGAALELVDGEWAVSCGD